MSFPYKSWQERFGVRDEGELCRIITDEKSLGWFYCWNIYWIYFYLQVKAKVLLRKRRIHARRSQHVGCLDSRQALHRQCTGCRPYIRYIYGIARYWDGWLGWLSTQGRAFTYRDGSEGAKRKSKRSRMCTRRGAVLGPVLPCVKSSCQN